MATASRYRARPPGSSELAHQCATTRSRALHHINKEQRRNSPLNQTYGIARDEPALPAEGETRVEGEELVQAIERALSQMVPREREVAVLRLRHQLTTGEIAVRLSISSCTVEVHIAPATKALCQQLPKLQHASG